MQKSESQLGNTHEDAVLLHLDCFDAETSTENMCTFLNISTTSISNCYQDVKKVFIKKNCLLYL